MADLNPALLVSDTQLQDFIISKTAIPLTAGVVTFYKDSDHTTLKNVYFQQGVYPNYTYYPAPNPLTLSAAGTVCDVNGVDQVLYFYPVNEDDTTKVERYYITVYDQYGTLQFTRANFPINSSTGGGTEIEVLDNLIINNRFWRNINSANVGTLTQTWTTEYNNTGTYYYKTICPSQHDSFTMPDINYLKDANGDTETITFNTFTQSTSLTLTDDIQPEYYINHKCTAAGSATRKFYQFPISLHLATLALEGFSFSIQGQTISGSANITASLYAYAGTGAASPAPTQIGAGTFTLTTAWSKISVLAEVFPSVEAISLPSSTQNDAWYLQIDVPVGGAFELNFTLPTIVLASELPTNSFQTYDQIDAIISSPRTGSILQSLNDVTPRGYVPMNDGVIVNQGTTTAPTNGAGVAYQGGDAFPLFSLLWNKFANLTYGGGSAVLPIYDSSGNATTYGASAAADWVALKQISLVGMLNRAILGDSPNSSLPIAFKTTFTVSNSAGSLLITTANNINYATAEPITFSVSSGGTLPASLSASIVYYVISNTSNSFYLATTNTNAYAGTKIAYSASAGSGTFTVSLGQSGLGSALAGSTNAPLVPVIGYTLMNTYMKL